MSGTGRILYALYGAPPTGGNIGFNDVTALVSAQYEAGQVVFTATNATYGPDPAFGILKSLIIIYAYSMAESLAPGVYPLNTFQTFTSTCPEDSSITLPPANVPRTDTTTPAPLDAVIDDVVGIVNGDPNLPGITSAQAIIGNAFANRSEEDAQILAGRLYLDASQTVTAVNSARRTSPSPFSSDSIRQALQSPFSPARVELPDFNALVAETRARMQSNAEFAQQIKEASAHATAARQKCRCVINGKDAACWKCIIIIVVVIIII